MHRRSFAFILIGVLAVTAAAAAEAQPHARIPPNAQTSVYVRGSEVAYVQRSPDNGPGVWLGFIDGQYVSSNGTSLVAYCTVGGLLYRWGLAKRRSAERWVISRLEPKRLLAGFAIRKSAQRWSITNPTRRQIAIAKGPDGPAAAVVYLTRAGC
jgi:hypothetical protein